MSRASRPDQPHLPPLRRTARPREGDTFETLAERELPQLDAAEAARLLTEWNPHLGRRLLPTGRPLLVSDLVYLEPPPQR